MTATLLRSGAEVTTAEQRIQAAFDAAQAVKVALATAQLENVSVSIEGHPWETYNGVYTRHSSHKGWPVLQNEHGRYCYRHAPSDEWFLHCYLTPDEGTSCSAYIMAKEGPLPVGEHEWRVYGGALSDWQGGTLAVTLLRSGAEVAAAAQRIQAANAMMRAATHARHAHLEKVSAHTARMTANIP